MSMQAAMGSLAGFGALAIAGFVHAAPITVVNAGFELNTANNNANTVNIVGGTPTNGSTTNASNMTGWKTFATPTAPANAAGVFEQKASVSTIEAPPEGVRWFNFDQRSAPAFVYQNVGLSGDGTDVVQAGTYTMTVRVHKRGGQPFPTNGFAVGLYADPTTTTLSLPANPLSVKTQADYTQPSATADRSSQDFTITFDSAANPSFNGQFLYVAFSMPGSAVANANQVFFDAVTLDFTPVPEPMGLAFLGAVGMLGFRCRRGQCV